MLPGLSIKIISETEQNYLNLSGELIEIRDKTISISNYEYEIKKNEEKRQIMLLKPEYLSAFIGDFRSIMKYGRSSQTIDSKTKKVFNPKLNP
jgi:RNase P/RNase MRP subunit p29